MGRCQAWRPAESSHQPVCLPAGGCHRCWRPCRATVPAGQVVCGQCVEAAANHVSAAVRSMLASSGLADVELLRRLALDPDIGVSATAQARLEEWELANADLAPAAAGAVAVPVWDGTEW